MGKNNVAIIAMPIAIGGIFSKWNVENIFFFVHKKIITPTAISQKRVGIKK